MLIQKSSTNIGDIVSFRLSSGEEIVGRMVSTTGNSLNISKPVIVSIHMMENNQASLAFMPFMASIDEISTVTFFDNHLVTKPMPTRKDIQDSYIQATSSLEIPTSSLVMP